MKMNKDIISLYDENNQKKEYKLLMIISKEYKYLIYTDIDNMDLNKNMYAIKTKELNKLEEILPISEEEWKTIEEEYNKIINK
jgi:uncharacterized protein YrzB (UPF0473 family)